MELRIPILAGFLALTACGSALPVATQVPSTSLVAAGGSVRDVRQLVGAAPFTVLIFFSRTCHCLDRHDARIRALYDAYHPRGVQVVMVDPEIRANPADDAAEASRRGYPFPLLVDPGAKLADTLGAQYATYAVVVDARGNVRYRGGFDSDETHLREGATPYVADALDDLLAGRPPRVAETKALGCSLETW